MDKKQNGNEAGSKIVLAYVPVLHEGYRRFFERHSDADKLILIGAEIIKAFKPLAKDLRALPPELMEKAIGALGYFKTIEVTDSSKLYPPKPSKAGDDRTEEYAFVEKSNFTGLEFMNDSKLAVIMPDEDIMHGLHDNHFPKAKAEYDPIFLRWDKHKSFESRQVEADQTISVKDFDKKIIGELKKEAEKSADFWRQIGSAVVKDGKIIMKAHNKAVPDEQMHYTEGDPRSDFHKGVNVDASLFFHSEAQLIAEAAKKGISLEGASMYATTFPCPLCSKLIAYSGIKRLYYADGYGVLDGERVLKSQGVEIIFVKMES